MSDIDKAKIKEYIIFQFRRNIINFYKNQLNIIEDLKQDHKQFVHKISTIEEPAFIVANISRGEHVPGDWDGEYKFYYSWVYDGKQESKLYEFPETLNICSWPLIYLYPPSIYYLS